MGINPAMAEPQPKPYIHHGGTESRRHGEEQVTGYFCAAETSASVAAPLDCILNSFKERVTGL